MANSPRVDNLKQSLLAKGTIIDGQFTILDYLGQGSTGVVYHAIDNNSQDDVVIKVIHPSLMEAVENKQQCLKIETIHQQLQHANIVPVLSVYQHDKQCFVVMPFLQGQTLRQLINKQKQSQQTFSVNQVIELISAITSGLSVAHAYTAHQNIKPENIWVTEQNHYILMDFGLALLQTPSQQTRSGLTLGTAGYLAPEQLKGTAANSQYVDQYSLAVIAYELLTGNVPSRDLEPLGKSRNDIPKAVEHALHKALSFQANNRFGTITAFQKAIEGSRPASFLFNHPLKLIGVLSLAIFTFYSLKNIPSHNKPLPVTIPDAC
ncbi:MAG: serine/threonine-protein kinase [Gammaproteobacteria bacterium]|nr:serine/threonine-protein kinase [Gammaproteobacteria bacterium]